MYAFTVTTKDKCRHCIVQFDVALQNYLISKGLNMTDMFYRLEESKFTKWHAHGTYHCKWETSKDDLFFVFFKEITDVNKWTSYCNKGDLDVGTPFFVKEDPEPCDHPHLGPREELRCLGDEAHFCYHIKKD